MIVRGSPARRAPRRRALRNLVALALALGAPVALAAPAGAQELSCDAGDLEVRGLGFTGNHRFTDLELANAIVTTPTDFLRRTIGILGERRCIEPAEVERDRYRLLIFYRNRGFYEATVDTAVARPRPGQVRVQFRMNEGPPVVIDSFVVAGLDSVRARGAIVRDLPLGEGDPFDKFRREVTRDTLLRRLRNRGYPFARVLTNYASDVANRRATVEYTVVPGPRSRVERVELEVAPRAGTRQEIPDHTVRALARVDSGDLYREDNLLRAQRALYATEAYERVGIAIDSAQSATDSLVAVRVRLAETFTHAASASVGYGTLDCLRTQGEYTDRNFLKRAGRLDLIGRVSKVGIGDPIDQAPALCTANAKADPFSLRLNYYAGATLRQPVLLGLRSVPSLTVFSERRSEYRAFLRTTSIGAIASLTNEQRRRTPVVLSYQFEVGRTEAEPALFCSVFNLCNAADQQQIQQTKPLAVVSLAVTRNRANNPLAPTSGSVARAELRHASRVVGSDRDLQFNKALGDVSWYRPVAGRTVLALRARAGAVVGTQLSDSARRFIPPQERLYAGGPNSVRGYRQNELGPVVYTVRGYDTVTVLNAASGATETYFRDTLGTRGRLDRTVPTGGNAVLVGNAELRFPSPFLPELVQLNTFVDVGQVWNPGVSTLNLQLQGFRWTPGVGARVTTPVGAIGVDLGYNAYAPRRGAAYFATPLGGAAGAGGSLPVFCVSPTNTIPVTTGANGALVPGAGACPASYRPPEGGGFLRRLNFNFSINQAF
jgi:outer membrane protein insertion porin family/translocation and assembly module TamA